MRHRLQIKLPKGWVDYSKENPDGPPTFLRDLSEEPGPLQISWAEYKGGVVPNPSAEDLQQMSREIGEQQDYGRLIESSNGECQFGRMGTATFQAPGQRVQLWHLSNGKDFIMVTHIGPEAPDPNEVREVKEIVQTLTLGETKPKWKFW